MYFYLFDSFLQDRRYQTEVLRLESRLAQLGLQGRTEKMTILKNVQEAATSAIKRGATTVVAVGNDLTVTKLLPIVIEHGLPLGIIPFGQPNTIAEYLGLPNGVPAADALSRRITKKLDVGQADSQYFLLQARLTAPAKIKCDGRYTVETLDPRDGCLIANLGSGDPYGQPNDNRLELIVQPHSTGWSWGQKQYSAASVFPVHQAMVQDAGDSAAVVLDGQITLKAPTTIGVAKKKLQVIVGPRRTFGD